MKNSSITNQNDDTLSSRFRLARSIYQNIGIIPPQPEYDVFDNSAGKSSRYIADIDNTYGFSYCFD